MTSDTRTGAILDQMNRARFLAACTEYRALTLPRDSTRFVLLSLEIHALRGLVPKSWWRPRTLLRREEVPA